jgi:hypothetical protein
MIKGNAGDGEINEVLDTPISASLVITLMQMIQRVNPELDYPKIRADVCLVVADLLFDGVAQYHHNEAHFTIQVITGEDG